MAYTDIRTEDAQTHSGSLKNRFDADKVQSELDLQREVSQQFSHNADIVRAEFNKDLDALNEKIKTEKDPEKQKEYEQQRDKLQQRQVFFNMVVAALSAPTDSAAGIAAATAAPAISYGIGQEFKNNKLKNEKDGGNRPTEGSATHIASHMALGAVVSALGGNDTVSGALAAGGAEALVPLFSKAIYDTKDPEKLTAEQKQNLSNMARLFGAAVGAATSNGAANGYANVAQGSLNAGNAVENNELLDEIEFGIRHPRIALLIGSVSKNPEAILNPNISTIASTFQLNLFNNRQFGGEGGVGNAFRHTLWQAIITNRFGKNIATQVGNSHETGFKIDFSKRENISLNKADEMIDQLNNKIGREIAIKNPNSDNKKLAINVLNYYLKEGLYQAEKNNSSNTYNVVKKKLPITVYNNAINKIGQLDATGAGPVMQQERFILQKQLINNGMGW